MSQFKFHPSQKNNFIWPCLLLILLGCGQHDKSRQGSRHAVKRPADTLASPPLARPTTTDTITQTDCPRGAAEPLVKKNTFKDAHFALQPDGITGIETFSLPEGDKVKIKNFGCEYYILGFELTTSRFAADTTDLQYWANTVLLLMREVNKGISTPLEINNGLKKLAARLQADGPKNLSGLTLNEEIDFGGPDPRQYLTIDRISKPADGRYLLKITFSYGPI